MRANAGIFIIIGLLFLVGIVGAVIPDQVIFTSNKNWVVANGVDQSIITVEVSNTTSGYAGPIKGATVNFAINNTLGTLSTASAVTDIAGTASSTFKVTTTSGATLITATVTYSDADGTFTESRTLTQKIDHDSPYYDISLSPPLFTYPAQGYVASQVPFKVSIYDRWGNPVDNRNPSYIHNVGLHVSSALIPDDSNFNGVIGQQDIYGTLDSNGTFSVNVRLTSKRGENKILMDNFEGKISSQIAWITAMAVDTPYSMTGTIYPGNTLPANNIDKFTIDYYLYDVFGNPIGNKSLSIYTNLSGETTPATYTSDTNGLIRFYYGPKISILTAKITAVALNNASVTSEIIANFINSSPTNMVLAVTPQVMASREVVTAEQALVRATVIDNFGNPVPNELVTFSLGNPSNGTYILKTAPALVSTTSTTNADGNAIVTFYPGSFAKWGEADYNSGATGSVEITATWEGFSQTVTATWKNYPYLSIESSAAPPSIKLNETIDVTIDVIGNGFKMQGGNVAAIMDIDSSSSIWSNNDVPGPKRIDSGKDAADAFAYEMLVNGTGNWVGVNSYGNEKQDNDRLLAPQTVYSLVLSKITLLTKGSNSQKFGASVTDAINNLTETHPSRDYSDKVRAVIVLKDSGGGNLEANGQKQAEDDAAAVIALAKGTTPKTLIFTVYYYDGNSESSSTQTILRNIANSTGGQFFRSENSDQLKKDFITIANLLKNTAGVNASMNLDFRKVEVNGTEMDGKDVFSYVPLGPFVTLDPVPATRDSIAGRTRIMWPNASHSVINQSDEWTATQQLHFNIGTINISQRWNTTYRLRINQTGLINLFNCTLSGSSLSFNDGTESLCLPNLYITVNPNTTPLGLSSGTLFVTDLVPDSPSLVYNDSVPMRWKLNYTGFDTVTETYWYSYRNQPFVQFGYVPNIPSTNGLEVPHSTSLDITKFPAGEYRIKVIAYVPGIPPAEDSGAFTKFYDTGAVSLLLR